MFRWIKRSRVAPKAAEAQQVPTQIPKGQKYMETLHGVRVYPFHGTYEGAEPQFHVSCEHHEDMAFCGELEPALRARARHLMLMHYGEGS